MVMLQLLHLPILPCPLFAAHFVLLRQMLSKLLLRLLLALLLM